MGKSFVKYKGFGFWSRDSFIESWLATLIAEMEKMQGREPWQQALMEHWRIQAQIDTGCMWVGLDDFLTDKARQQFVFLWRNRPYAPLNR